MSLVKSKEVSVSHVMSTQQACRGFPLRMIVAGLVLWGLVGCQTSPPVAKVPPGVTAPAPAAPSTAPTGAHEYAVVAEESLLQILVYRGGAMARLGHNHVIASHQLAGAVFLTDDPLKSRFDIHFAV